MHRPVAAPLLFLDIEASSLAPDSWPVEIGWAWLGLDGIDVRSAVVAPRPAWNVSSWSEGAGRIHGLSLDRVRRGWPADMVAAMTDSFAGFHTVSDNPAWDQLWLDRLREGRPRIRVHPLRTALAERLSAPARDVMALALLRSRSVHRAGDDAARLAGAWAAATAVDDAEEAHAPGSVAKTAIQ
jgi:hypothetical protein